MMLRIIVCLLAAACLQAESLSLSDVQQIEQQLQFMQQQITADSHKLQQQIDTMNQQLEQITADNTKLKKQMAARDITHKKLAAENSRLGESVKSLQLENQELRVRLEEDSRAVGSVLGRLAHDSQEQRFRINKAVAGIEHDMQDKAVAGNQQNTVVTFSAYASVTGTYNNASVVLFDSVIINEGSDYNPSSSIFKCNTAGYYLFSAVVRAVGGYTMYAEIVVGNTAVAGMATGNDWDTAANTVVYLCPQGAIVFVRARLNGNRLHGSPDSAHSMFTGTLLFPQ